jgi:hypothetical protein
MKISRIVIFLKKENGIFPNMQSYQVVKNCYTAVLILNANRPTNFEAEMFDRTARHRMAGIPFALLIAAAAGAVDGQSSIEGHLVLLHT